MGNVYPDAGGLEEIYQVFLDHHRLHHHYSHRQHDHNHNHAKHTKPVYRASSEGWTQLHRHGPILWTGEVSNGNL